MMIHMMHIIHMIYTCSDVQSFNYIWDSLIRVWEYIQHLPEGGVHVVANLIAINTPIFYTSIPNLYVQNFVLGTCIFAHHYAGSNHLSTNQQPSWSLITMSSNSAVLTRFRLSQLVQIEPIYMVSVDRLTLRGTCPCREGTQRFRLTVKLCLSIISANY